jgi:hypothetical protein
MRVSGIDTPYADSNRPTIASTAATGSGVSWDLNGNVTAVGAATPVTARVYWGTTNYGTRNDLWGAPIEISPTLGAPATVSTNVGGLTPSAQYFYRYSASNSYGTAWSPVTTNFFTEGPPSIETLAATGVGSTNAWLLGQYLDDGESPTTVYLYWGTSAGNTPTPPALGTWDNVITLNPQPAEGSTIDTNLAGLVAGQTYHYRFAASNSVGVSWGSGATNFTTYTVTVPNDLSGAVLWLQADKGVTSPGGAVTAWLDQTRYTNNASGGADGFGLPTHVNNALNGLPVVNFASDRLGYPSITARSALYVFKYNSFAQVARFAGLGTGTVGGDGNALHHTNGDGSWSASGFAGSGDLRVNNVATFNHTSGQYHIVDVVAAGGLPWTRIGGTDNDGEFCNGDLAEIMVFDRVLTSTERAQMGQYLAQKYFNVSLYGPEMDVYDWNSVAIANGGSSPNFGSVVPAGSTNRTFTIQNPGVGALSLTNSPKVVVGGPDAADFTVTSLPALPATPVAGVYGGVTNSTTFTVQFAPTTVGTKTATLTIPNNDADEAPYLINISGVCATPLGSVSVIKFR